MSDLRARISGVSIGGLLSAEGESVGLHAWIEKVDFERMICDGSVLAQKLIEPLFGDGAGARRIHITAAIVSGRNISRLDGSVSAPTATSRSKCSSVCSRLR
jgi:hypothetical protein